MDAQAANLRRGRTWSVRPAAVVAIVVATFAVGVIVGRQPMLAAADTGRAAVAVPGAAAPAPDRDAERDALIRFRAAERSMSAAIVPTAAERDALIDFRAGERSLGASVPPTTERDALIDFRAAERASRTDGQRP
jgi:hypothetical protein